MKEASRIVYFVTQNRGKYMEARRVAEGYGIELRQLNLAKREIQADGLTDVASFAAKHAAQSKHHAVISEDAGLFVDSLKGFPGPYSSYVFRTIGTRGILRLLAGVKRRRAAFKAAVAYCEPRRSPRCFTGIVRGVVSQEARGSLGFGFDPIFVPLKGDGRTFAEMSIEEKNEFSHRANAFKSFCKWYSSRA